MCKHLYVIKEFVCCEHPEHLKHLILHNLSPNLYKHIQNHKFGLKSNNRWKRGFTENVNQIPKKLIAFKCVTNILGILNKRDKNAKIFKFLTSI